MENSKGAKAVRVLLRDNGIEEEATGINWKNQLEMKTCNNVLQQNFRNVASLSINDETDRSKESFNDFVLKFQQSPDKISAICKPETNETIIHILAKEGQLDILKDVCDEQKTLLLL